MKTFEALCHLTVLTKEKSDMVNLGRINPGLLKNKLRLILNKTLQEGSGVNNGKTPTDRRNRFLLVGNSLFRGTDVTRVKLNSVFISLRQALPSLAFCGVQRLQAYKICSQQPQWNSNSSLPESQNNSNDSDNNAIPSCLGSV